MKSKNHWIYSDGACSGNPGPGGWGCLVVTRDGWVIERGGAAKNTTNNQMELMGVIRGLEILEEHPGPVTVLTDSLYLIRGITEWIRGWKTRGWKNSVGEPVANRDLWEALDERVSARRAKKSEISFQHVPGHAGIPPNERVDQIAVAYSKGENFQLYEGALSAYSIRESDLEPNPQKWKYKTHYLSLVSGKLVHHDTWPECEARVKGQSGAKFKKVSSSAEEQEVLKAWGVLKE